MNKIQPQTFGDPTAHPSLIGLSNQVRECSKTDDALNSLFLKTTQIKDHRLRMKIISYMYSDYRAKVDGIKMIPVDLRTHLINFIIGKLRSLENATKANYKRS